ncbi:MAG TPA: DsbA family oxidoreductase [Solirubrobacteraceae bacterium]|nr:DsbA family oxidoreductase [Solirubrobacteraceae bacterium]
MSPLAVEIWSDVVCPWCYVGKRRFEKALEGFAHRDDVEVTWRSFELDPQAPPQREHTSAEHLASKYGLSLEQAEGTNAQMTELAADEGLEYHLDRTKGGNSFAAHRLIQRAVEDGRQDAMKERLMRAYFTDGEAIGDHNTLVRLAGEVGVDGQAALTDERYADGVRADEELAARIGIRGVPYFVLDRRYGVSGAQPPELLLQALEKAVEP